MNVITGTSDSGKTATLRALSWLINNRPSGDAFKNWNVPLKEPVSVSVELEEISTIVDVLLQRRDGKNSYSVFDKNGEETVFSAIRQDVPSEVVSLLNIAEYNFQSQHQNYFLLQDTPGEVAKKLNDLVGLSIIDKLFSNLASLIKQTSARILHFTSEQDRAEKELDKYKNLDKIRIIIESIEKTYAENEVASASLSQIIQKLSTLRKIKEEREKLIPLLEAETKVNSILNKITEGVEEETRIRILTNLIISLKKIKEEIEDERIWENLEPTCIEMTDKINELRVIVDQTTKIEAVINLIKITNKSIEAEKQTIKSMAAEYLELIRTSNICPTCGNRIDQVHLTAIEKSLTW